MSKHLDMYPQHRCKCAGTDHFAHTLWCPARSWYSVAKTRTVGRTPRQVSKLSTQYTLAGYPVTTYVRYLRFRRSDRLWRDIPIQNQASSHNTPPPLDGGI